MVRAPAELDAEKKVAGGWFSVTGYRLSVGALFAVGAQQILPVGNHRTRASTDN
jgi:hypothetical protein